ELGKASIPRCKDNSAFFVEFGFPATETDCEGGEEEAPTETTNAETSTLSAEEEEEAEETLAAIVKCDGKGNADISLPAATEDVLGPQECVVKEFTKADGTTGTITNGEVYTFFVASVLGDDFSK